MARILHFSDIHVHVPWTDLMTPSWQLKRWVGAANLFVRRERLFRDGASRLRALHHFMQRERVDLVLCTGDYTTLGTDWEMKLARDAVEPFTQAPLGFVTVPGNHDLYMRDSVRGRLFERYFHDFLHSDVQQPATGDRLANGGTSGRTWPLVRLVNESIAVVAVNSSRPNAEPWRSSGRIPDEELSDLKELLAHPEIAKRFVFVITHYAPRRKDGSPDTTLHGLENGEDFLQACRGIQRGAILHGHIHWPYRVQVEGLRTPLFCAGSATHAGRESCWVYDYDAAAPGASTATLYQWADGSWEKPEDATFSLLET